MARHKKMKQSSFEKFVGPTLSEDSAFIGAAQALSDASMIAKKKKNIEGLMNTVEGWLTLSKMLGDTNDLEKSDGYGMIGLTSHIGDDKSDTERNNNR